MFEKYFKRATLSTFFEREREKGWKNIKDNVFILNLEHHDIRSIFISYVCLMQNSNFENNAGLFKITLNT